MELKYCDDCGAVLTEATLQSGCPENKADCKFCKGGACATAPAAAPARTPAAAPPPEEHFSSPESLELFSEASLHLKKQALEERPAGPTTTVQAPDTGEFTLPPEENLELFSEQTIAMKKAPKPAASENADSRFRFRCVGCNSMLEIKAVTRLSKLVCPRCSEKMYIDPEQGVSRDRPQNKPEKSFDLSGRTRVPALGTGTGAQAPAPLGENGENVSLDELFTPPQELVQTSGSQQLRKPAPIAPRPREAAESPAPEPVARPEAAGSPAPVPPAPVNESEPPHLPTPIREPRYSASRQVVYALVFGLSLAAPLLVTSFLIHVQRTPASEQNIVGEWVLKGLDELGQACKNALSRLTD